MGFTWFKQVILGYTEIYSVFNASTGFYWTILGYNGFYLV